jgi:hypothetical protein
MGQCDQLRKKPAKNGQGMTIPAVVHKITAPFAEGSPDQ